MSLVGGAYGFPEWGFPRVSGDEPYAASKRRPGGTFSPRERG